MKYKKSMIMLVLVIFIFGAASVCASDVNDTAIANEDDMAIELSQADSDERISAVKNDEIISEGNVGTFSELQINITEKYGSTLILTKDYEHEDDFDSKGIIINQSITIDGQGHKIDAQGKSRIFKITADNVILKNINFINGNTTLQGGGAVHFEKSGTVSDCNFINNTATDDGGAIYLDSGSIKNCNFTNNTASQRTGAVCFDSFGTVENCNFVNNVASLWGSAIRMPSGNVMNSNFTNNVGDGGAINMGSGSVENCNFVKNIASNDGGAVYIYKTGTVTNCNFTNNTAKSGNAIFISKGNVAGCDFTNNYISKGAIHSVTGNITLSNNILDVNDVVDGKNFTYIQKLIDNAHSGDIITIDGSYSSFGIPIIITKSLTLIGTNNATFDAKKLSKILFITANNVTIKNICFTNGYSQNGGAVYFNSTGTVENCNFINNAVNEDGGAVYFNSTGTVSNCNFTNNKATGDYSYGGAVYFNDNGELVDCNFADNTAEYGGAVFSVENVTVETISCNFINNSAVETGGAVFIYSESNFTDCNFINNSAEWGSAIIMDSGSLTGCNFEANSAIRGSAVYFYIGGNLTDCNFANNIASGDGGAVYFEGSGNVANCNFTNNSASYGGALYFYDNGAVENCNFADNTANRSGGAIWMDSGSVTGCNFADNTATRDGGAVKMYSGNVTQCAFTDNTAIRDGGAVYFKENGAVENCNFTANTAAENGGAVYLNNESDVINCNFNDNSAYVHGGAVDIYSGNIVNCNFNGNTVTTMGGAIYSYAQSNITNCNFTDNKADYSAGALGINGDSKVSNTNFKNNVAGDGSNDIVTTNNATVTLENVSPENITPLTHVNLDILVNNVTYPNTVEIKVNVTENHKGLNEGSAYVVISNKTYAADVVNGTAAIKIPNLGAGNYEDVKVTFNGSGKYTNSFDIISFTVLKQETAITAASKTYVINYGGKYYITLKDKNGKKLSGKTVTLTINGKTYKATTNAKGVATIKLSKARLKSAGTKKATIKFAGDKNYNASSKTVKITVKKETVKILKAKKTYSFKKSKKTKNINVVLKNSKNKAMKKVKVTIKLTGKKIKGKKTITAKSNSKGIVTFKLAKKLTQKTKVKYTLTYKGNAYYNKVTKKGKIIVK